MDLADTYAQRGIVAAGPPAEPAEAGIRMIREGGNAIDAAVAAALVESAVNPNVSGLGGSGGMVIYLADERRCTAIDYNTRAPAKTHDRVFDGVLDSLSPDRTRRLRDAAWNPYQLMLVPGCASGLELAVKRYGRKTWSEVVAPALESIHDGLQVHERLARELPGLIAKREADEARSLLTIDARAPRLGERLPLKPFLRVFKELASHGSEGFYRGPIARQLVQSVEAHRGALSAGDLAEYSAREVEPIQMSYRGYDVLTCPLALGGISVLQTLELLQAHDLRALSADTPEWADLLVQTYREVWRYRLSQLGDPDCVQTSQAAPTPGWRGGPGTIHISAADGEGNMVALTQSLIGGGHFVPELGLIVNQAMIMFDPRPGHPNCPGPRKQPLVNMSPVLILKDGQPAFALGAPGARHIISAVSQMIVNLIDFKMGPTEAIAAPRVHCEDIGSVLVETCTAAPIGRSLSDAGHNVEIVERVAALGHIVQVDRQNDRLTGATDPRGSRSQWDGRVGTVSAM